MKREDYPKVLVVSPTYIGKDYIFKENFEAIKSLDYPNYEYLYIDNTDGLSYTRTLRERGAKVVHVRRDGNSRQALCNAQNYARNKLLSENYDYLMFVESDLIPPKDIIQRLLSHAKPVVGGLYYIGTDVIKVPCIFFTEYKKDIHQVGTRLIRLDEVDKFINTGLQQVHGLGLGCTIIRRDIVERFPFWFDGRFTNKHSDVYFYMELHNNNIPVFVDTDINIPHFPSDWKLVKDK